MTENNEFSSLHLLTFIIKHFKLIAILTTIGAIASIVVSLSLQEKYKSMVVVFPAASGSLSKMLISDNSRSAGVTTFGEEEEAEQMLQVLHSDEIRQRIIQKYSLMEHYDISLEDKYPYTKLGKEFEDNFSFRRTKFMSVEIEVLDSDPQLAAAMANDISALVDTVMNRMEKERALKALAIVQHEYEKLEKEIHALEDSLTGLRQLGIIDYETQAEAFNNAYAQALGRNDAAGIRLLESKMEVFKQHGGAYLSIIDFLEYEKEQLSLVKAKYAEAKVDAEQEIPHKFIIDTAKVAEKKSYPVRWLIVVLSTGATFLTAIFALLISENIQQLRHTLQSNKKAIK